MPWDFTWLCNCMLFAQWVLVVAAGFERNQILWSFLGPSIITNSDSYVSGSLFSLEKGWAFPRFLVCATSCMTNCCAVSYPGRHGYCGDTGQHKHAQIKGVPVVTGSSLTSLLPLLANNVRPWGCSHQEESFLQRCSSEQRDRSWKRGREKPRTRAPGKPQQRSWCRIWKRR